MVPEWFRKRSMYRLRINLMRIPSALGAKISVALFVVLSSYFGGPFKCLEEYVGFLRNIFVGFRKVYVYVPGKVAGQNQYL